jgi:serine/threonine protein kinase
MDDPAKPQATTLQELETLLKTKKPRQIFAGNEPDKLLHDYRIIAHPDRHSGDKLATDVFQALTVAWDAFKKPARTIKSPKRTYTIGDLIASGDIADIYEATSENKDWIVKVSRVQGGFQLMKNEASTLGGLLTAAAASDPLFTKILPLLAENFPAKDKIQKHVTVYAAAPNHYDLKRIIERHKHLGDRHLVWIMKRLLTAIGFAHMNGVIHGAILPEHVMLDTPDHGIKLVGWGHAVKTGETIKTISSQYRSWYPREVINKGKASPETDIYMAAKCLVYLAGGDPVANVIPTAVAPGIQRFLRACMLEGQSMRPRDAWTLHDEFSDMANAVFGKPKFVELAMS